MKRKIAWLSILLLILGVFGGCKRSPDEAEKVAGAATEVVRQEETETVQPEEEMIPPADQPEAEEPPKAGETVEEKEEQITPPETQAPQKPEVEEPSVEPEPQEPSEGKDEPEANEPEEEIDLNSGNRFSPRKPAEPGYDKYYCDATIDDEFEPGVLTVRLINAVSYPNKKWPLSTFACVDPVSAVHTNYYDDPEVIDRLNLDIYTQSFEITLKEKTKEAVLKAIRELEKLDIVYFAEPISTVGHSVERTTKDSSSIKETTAFDAQVNYGFNFIGNANGFDATTQTSMPYYPFYDYR